MTEPNKTLQAIPINGIGMPELGREAASPMELTMQSVEEYMRRLFDEKIEMEKQRLARVAPFRQKFFTRDCDYGTRPGVLEQLQSEKVQSITVSGSEAEVITTQIAFYVHSEASFEMRYLLRAEGEGWLVYEVDLRCCSCDGQPPKADCPCCHGTSWRNTSAKTKHAA